MTWHILLIEPRHEFSVAGHLSGYGFTPYLPTIQRVVRRGCDRRRVTVDRPLFPGYLFLFASTARQSLVRSVSGIRGYLTSGDTFATLSDAAILALRLVEENANAAFSKKQAWPFKVGDRVRINNHIHAAHMVSGVLKRLDKSDRAVIEIMMPSRAVAVTTSAAWLEAI